MRNRREQAFARHGLPFVRRLLADETGAIGLMFALILPMVIAFAGVSVDYASLSAQRTKLQAVADGAALAAAREFRLGNANVQTLNQAAAAHAGGSLAGQDMTATVTPTVDLQNRSITVALTSDVPTLMMKYLGPTASRIDAVATAKMIGGPPICVIGLDQWSFFTVGLDKNAKISAPGCAIYSNSKNPLGLFARNRAEMRAAFICSAGGRDINGGGLYIPTPKPDCPVIPDPLASRPVPTVGTCTENNFTVNSGTRTLMPGTYCGGIKINNGANVTLQPGIYIMKDGPFSVGTNGTVSGVNVALYFSGNGSAMDLQAASNISLTAPKTGIMAGMLIAEDKNSPAWQFHKILSNNARTLLGTIYLPRGVLHVGATSAVADMSAYTIVVVRQFYLTEGPTMVLNANYGATDIPVPEGVGPLGSKTVLSN